MRVLYATASVIPSRSANSVHVMCMSEALAASGHAVTLVGIRGDVGLLRRNANVAAFYGVTENFGLALSRRVSVPGLARLAFTIHGYRQTLVQRPDVLYCRDLVGGWLLAPTARNVVAEVHEVPATPSERAAFAQLLRNPKTRRVVVISHALCDLVRDAYPLWPQNVDLAVVPDGVDLGCFDQLPNRQVARRGLGIGDVFTVTYVGHLYPGRGIEIVAALAREFPDVVFQVIGGHPQDVERRSGEFAGLRNLRFAGHQPRSELSRYWAASDVLVMPYQANVAVEGGGDTSEWMSPLKMFEYMAASRPLISSDLPVLREVLEDGRNALLVEPASIDSWASALRRLRAAPGLAAALASRARDDVKQYAWPVRAARVLDGIC